MISNKVLSHKMAFVIYFFGLDFETLLTKSTKVTQFYSTIITIYFRETVIRNKSLL